jgi:hypothetical protein
MLPLELAQQIGLQVSGRLRRISNNESDPKRAVSRTNPVVHPVIRPLCRPWVEILPHPGAQATTVCRLANVGDVRNAGDSR